MIELLAASGYLHAFGQLNDQLKATGIPFNGGFVSAVLADSRAGSGTEGRTSDADQAKGEGGVNGTVGRS